MIEKLRQRYLNLLEASLTGILYGDPSGDPWSTGYDLHRRALGRDWPQSALTMIGTARMQNLRHVCETVLLEDIPGDFIETGIWRGGACIYMKGILASYGDTTRRVFVADSFQGLPPPDVAYPADQGSQYHTFQQLAVSRAEVEANFRAYQLLDERVMFLEGWFHQTLPGAPIERLAVLRLDGDLYASTIQALTVLYPKVSPGGFVIIDDFNLETCARAVHDFRNANSIAAPIIPIDGMGAWWRV